MATPSTKPFSDGIASSPLDKGPNIFPRCNGPWGGPECAFQRYLHARSI